MVSQPDLWVPRYIERTKENPASVLSQSVQTTPQDEIPISHLISWIAHQADGFIAWGQQPKARDRQLRQFLPLENGLISAQSIVAARNAALSWRLTGDGPTIEAAHEMINNCNYGGGWEQFTLQVSHDLYSTDSGAFVELIREDPRREDSPVVSFAHMDSLRCYQTGNPEYPVLYEDIDGRMHRMPWHNVIHLLEMPAPIADRGPLYRLQWCAVTRVLRAAQVLRSISQYKDEKVSGRFMRAIHLISGASDTAIRDAIARANANADSAGQEFYIQPAVVSSVDPNKPLQHEQIDMSSLPEGWDEEKSYRIYIMVLAMGYLTDYQEFAPLPGGNLGTSAQSEILHSKSKGKGPGLFQKLFIRMMNGHGILPKNVLFEYDEPDLEARELEDKNAKTRAEARQIRVESGELDAIAAQQIAFEEGDLPEAVYQDLVKRQEAERRRQEADAAARQQQLQQAAAQNQQRPQDMIQGTGDQPTVGDFVASGDSQAQQQPAAGRREVTAIDGAYDPEEYGMFKARDGGVPFGNLLSSRLHRAYSDVSDDTLAMGYFRDTEQRVEVANAIGPALEVLEELLREAGIYDIMIAPEDVDRIAAASMQLIGARAATNDLPSPIGKERRDYEAEVGQTIAKGLERMRRIVKQRLEAAAV